MAERYDAVDTRFHRLVTIKMLQVLPGEDEQVAALFAHEATLLSHLNHPSLPRVHDFFREGDRQFHVMDFVDGRLLTDVFEQDGHIAGLSGARGVAQGRARTWTWQLCQVLEYLHRQSPPLIFLDLKATTVIITSRDETRLIDFGMVPPVSPYPQSTMLLRVGYAPPEQLQGMPEPRSDLYALGATLHRSLTDHDASKNQPSVFSFPPLRALRPDISPAFEAVIMKALSPSLEQRWQSAANMQRALSNLPPLHTQRFSFFDA